MNENKYLFNMDCPKCGASLELDIDHLISFCPYCGGKLLVDPLAFKDVLVEKEKTKRVGMQYAQEDKEREDANQQRAGKVKASVVLAIIGVVLFLVGEFAGSTSGDSDSPWYAMACLGLFPLIAIPYIWFVDSGKGKGKKR